MKNQIFIDFQKVITRSDYIDSSKMCERHIYQKAKRWIAKDINALKENPSILKNHESTL